MQLALVSRNPLLRTGYCWLGNFFARLSEPLPSKCTLTYAHSFAELSLKFPSADPNHQQGAHQRKSKHQGPWRLALAKPYFWKLGCCIWSLLLETSESNVRQYQRQVQGCAAKPWYLAVAKPRLRKPKGKVNVRYHSPAGPQGGRRW